MTAPITLALLNAMSASLILATPLQGRVPETLTIEEARIVKQADRVRTRLVGIEVNDLADDAIEQFGALVSASRGLKMRPVGLVASTFLTDPSSFSCIMGPYGSAKTTTCFQKIIWAALQQKPGRDGVRRLRCAIFRDTYGHLEANVMRDWFMWFPRTDRNFSMASHTHKLRLDIPGANRQTHVIELEIVFMAAESMNIEAKAKGSNFTVAWFNEYDTLHPDVFKFMYPRCGRYLPPGTPRGGWYGAWADMNAPDSDNPVYDQLVNKNWGMSAEDVVEMQKLYGPNFNIKLHRQPGGFEPNAENLDNLPEGYYQRLRLTLDEQGQRRFIDNQFGAVRSGSPVYSQYRDEVHCLDSVALNKSLPVHFGLDGGNTPAVVFLQKALDGQVRQVDECVIYQPDGKKSLERVGAFEFGVRVGEYWNENFGGCELGGCWADPATWEGGSHSSQEDSVWIERFAAGFNSVALGVTIKPRPAPVKRNAASARLGAVRDVLDRRIDGRPGYVLAHKCKTTREGFNRGYVTTRVQYSTGGGRWKDEPEKNDFSHVHDALQYGVLGITKFAGWQDAVAGNDSRHAARKSYKNVKASGFASAMGRR
jgi:hypothetical protein